MNCKKIKKLLQLYIDDALTFGEKQLVKEHLEGCSACRTELKSLSASIKLIKSLPEVSTPPNFTQNLMAKISREEIRIQSSWLDRLKKQVTIPGLSFPSLPMSFPRKWESILSFRFAGAAAITAIFVFLAFTFLFNFSGLPGQPNQKEAAAQQVEVTFTISGIKANQIAVAGDFNGWNTNANQLEDPDGDGIWIGKMQLEPGRYEYMLVVDDGKWVTDPNAKVYADDGFGSRNAVLFINNNG
jgi:anti-sigma factor RsiW